MRARGDRGNGGSSGCGNTEGGACNGGDRFRRGDCSEGQTEIAIEIKRMSDKEHGGFQETGVFGGNAGHSAEMYRQKGSRRRKKRKKNPLQEGPLKDIGFSVGMHSYKGGVGINFRGD
jgi:hypothetical protein